MEEEDEEEEKEEMLWVMPIDEKFILFLWCFYLS